MSAAWLGCRYHRRLGRIRRPALCSGPGCWHLPLFLIPGYEEAAPGLLNVSVAFGIFLAGITSISVVFTWVFNHTRQSLLIAVLLHASANAALAAGGHARIVTAALTAALALAIVAATRGRSEPIG